MRLGVGVVRSAGGVGKVWDVALFGGGERKIV